MIYILFYILVYILLQREAKSPLPNMTIRRIIPILFTLFIGLRGANVGQDTGVYYQHYYMFGQFGCDFVEPGFDWINRFCYHQGWESWTMFVICAALTIFPMYLMMNKLDRREYTIVAMFFYCCTYATIANGIRQAVACAIFVYLMSFYFEKQTYSKKEIFIFVIGILLASLMHASAILLLPVLIFNRIPAKKSLYVAAYIISFVFLVVDISPYIPQITLGTRDYSGYVENIKIAKASGLGFFVSTVLKLLILYCMCKLDTFKKHRILSHFVMFSFILSNIGFNIPMAGRITMYFSWFVYILVAKMFVEDSNYNSLHLLRTSIIICYLAITLNGVFSAANKLNPYTLYWQNNNYEKYLYYND